MKIIQFEGTAEEYEEIRETLFPQQVSVAVGWRPVEQPPRQSKANAVIPSFAQELSDVQRKIFHALWAHKSKWITGAEFAQLLVCRKRIWYGMLGGLARKINSFFNTDEGLHRLIDVGYRVDNPERAYKLKEGTKEWWDEVFAHP